MFTFCPENCDYLWVIWYLWVTLFYSQHQFCAQMFLVCCLNSNKHFFFTTCLGEISQQVKLQCNRLDNQDTGVWFLTWLEIFLFSKASRPYMESIQTSVQLVLRPATHYPHVTWAHVMLRVRLECDRRFNIEFYGADSYFCHSAYVMWSRVELWSAHVSACLWEACWHVCRPELHVRSHDISRVTEV
jgi:hypothetical protein